MVFPHAKWKFPNYTIRVQMVLFSVPISFVHLYNITEFIFNDTEITLYMRAIKIWIGGSPPCPVGQPFAAARLPPDSPRALRYARD